MKFSDLMGALGGVKTEALPKQIADVVQEVPGAGNFVKNMAGYAGWNQDDYDADSLFKASQDAAAEQKAAELDKLRAAQGQYEDATNPPWYKQLYQGALKKAGDFGDFLKSDTGRNIAGAGLNLGAGLYGLGQTSQAGKEQLSSYDEAMRQSQAAKEAALQAMQGVKEDPEQMALRQQALKGLAERAQMGLTPEEKANLADINRQAANRFQAAQAQIGQEQTRRGVQLGGLGLAQSMGAAEQALQNQALAGQKEAAMSFQNKQAALANLGTQANQAIQSDYQRQMGKAQELGSINRFNAQQQGIYGTEKGAVASKLASGKAASASQLAQTATGYINPNTVAQAPQQPQQATQQAIQQPQQQKKPQGQA